MHEITQVVIAAALIGIIAGIGYATTALQEISKSAREIQRRLLGLIAAINQSREEAGFSSYEILAADSTEALQELVRLAMERCCQPLGGVVMLRTEDRETGEPHMLFVQAMVG